MFWRVLVLAAALSTVTASACTYDPKIDANGFKCKANGDCPSGYKCAKVTDASAGVCCNKADQTLCLPPVTRDATVDRGLDSDGQAAGNVPRNDAGVGDTSLIGDVAVDNVLPATPDVAAQPDGMMSSDSPVATDAGLVAEAPRDVAPDMPAEVSADVPTDVPIQGTDADARSIDAPATDRALLPEAPPMIGDAGGAGGESGGPLDTPGATGGGGGTGGVSGMGGVTDAGVDTPLGGNGGTSGTGGTSTTGGTVGMDGVDSFVEASGPRCAGLASTCGPQGNENCCTSLSVPGGTYNRSNDPSYPATVSDFYLDRFEVTVGRFRVFLNAGMGTQLSPPVSGSGAHPLITGSGWDSAWNTNLATDADALSAAVNCTSTTEMWTESPSANEDKPMNCITWFEAFAFCAWDGGRLPTEAEWNYAAAGGSEQRVYPWGSTAPDNNHAVYSSPSPLNVGSVSPAGDGKWGQADLAGNVDEWNLDSYANWPISYPPYCNNCAAMASNLFRVILRGGGFNNDATAQTTSGRYYNAPQGGRFDGVGARCARASGL